ncbi:MAG: NUDIX domain-containing protein [Nanoarchaeota archaeon]|nr:NUDIX domain-containing protein [Nanoarchaeota archaeon]
MEKNMFKVKIVGIIFDPKTRKILVGKSKEDKVYSFLEGALSQEEELDNELKKITKEKTGYIVHNLGSIYAENYLEDKEKLKLYFLCEATEGEEKRGKEVKELQWIKPSEAEEKLNVKFPTRLREFILGLE